MTAVFGIAGHDGLDDGHERMAELLLQPTAAKQDDLGCQGLSDADDASEQPGKQCREPLSHDHMS
jgi:hypothetical protein